MRAAALYGVKTKVVYDVGVRNALINSFNPLRLRDDAGRLWGNYIAMERLKKQHYKNIYSNNYFWRTYSKQEIDWVEERGGKLYGFEIKWGEAKQAKPPKDWLKAVIEKQGEIRDLRQKRFTLFFLLDYEPDTPNIKLEFNQRVSKNNTYKQDYILGVPIKVTDEATTLSNKLAALTQRKTA